MDRTAMEKTAVAEDGYLVLWKEDIRRARAAGVVLDNFFVRAEDFTDELVESRFRLSSLAADATHDIATLLFGVNVSHR